MSDAYVIPFPDVMPKVNGKPFRCSCGCNVFKEYRSERFQCNECSARYVGVRNAEGSKR